LSLKTHTKVLRFVLSTKTKNGYKPLALAAVQIIITDEASPHDTLIYKTITSEYGSVNEIAVTTGIKNIQVKRSNCQPIVVKNLKVYKSQILYLSFPFICQPYLDGLSKKIKSEKNIIN